MYFRSDVQSYSDYLNTFTVVEMKRLLSSRGSERGRPVGRRLHILPQTTCCQIEKLLLNVSRLTGCAALSAFNQAEEDYSHDLKVLVRER